MAGVIYIVIAVLTGASLGNAIVVGAIVALITFVIAFAISRTLASRHTWRNDLSCRRRG
jgi:H+/gluconate symporter-like permease